ncbi:HEAT repeat domain-containing protein [Pectobacterium brasiliense]|uniref:HEAT repeat domain-containing protein n=1 Tax=Pectobacterium brasiliense TaxID=180957 RepID=UPI002A7F5BC7|nr:HEAT repeat domain-containing protein [Pectobacterium brasiliense]MDY4382598.1 HEAT repeat domain-containing protein [Pectobacterium brasiliense]
MASYDLLLYQLEKLVASPDNYYRPAQADALGSASHLITLTRHYNGHIRQRAVLCLGFMNEVSALPALIERVNDWAEPVRRAAKQSVRLLLTSDNAKHFVDNLPAIFWLLQRQREDHQPLVDEIVSFLVGEAHAPLLLVGLSSEDKTVARLSLDILVERELFPLKQIFGQAMLHHDPLVRVNAARYLLSADKDVDHDAMAMLLKDTFALIKQAALQYVIDNAFPVSEPQLIALLFDKNALVRQRASTLLRERNSDPVAHYLAALDRATTVTMRKITLWGLDEHRYDGIVALAERNLDERYPSLYHHALRILILRIGDDARERLLASLRHPSIAIAKVARKLFYQQKIYLSLPELQRCLEEASSREHIEVYYFLAHKLNKWDWLILLLDNAKPENTALTQAGVECWIQRFNHSGILPGTRQQVRLRELLDKYPHVISRKSPYIALFLFGG